MGESDPRKAEERAAEHGSLQTSRRLGTVTGARVIGTMVHLEVQVPEWKKAGPGQFALLQAEDSDCFLGRALSISDQSGEMVSFLVAPLGKGTRELCSLTAGSGVWVVGPLGNGFDVDAIAAGAERVLLVGGGAGIAPFPLLVKELVKCEEPASRGAGGGRPDIVVLAGFRDAGQAMCGNTLAESVSLAGASGATCSYEAVMEDESAGPAERASDLLERTLRSGDHVVVCGPEAMARAVWDVCRPVPEVRVWFSLETNMACGVGSCHGCVIELADGSYARVCREGPVFSGEEVFGE